MGTSYLIASSFFILGIFLAYKATKVSDYGATTCMVILTAGANTLGIFFLLESFCSCELFTRAMIAFFTSVALSLGEFFLIRKPL
jgi:hypothetical protein